MFEEERELLSIPLYFKTLHKMGHLATEKSQDSLAETYSNLFLAIGFSQESSTPTFPSIGGSYPLSLILFFLSSFSHPGENKYSSTQEKIVPIRSGMSQSHHIRIPTGMAMTLPDYKGLHLYYFF